MAAIIGNGISHAGLFDENYQFPWFISGTVTSADIGKAVTQDITAARTVKLAGDGDTVLGRLETLELRTVEGVNVATVSHKGGMTLPYVAGAVPAIGDTVQGGTVAGKVKTIAPSQDTPAAGGATTIELADQSRKNIVTFVDTTNLLVEVILF